MIDKDEIRNILLSKIDSKQNDETLVENLEKLIIFDSENQLDMERFYTKLNEIVSWSEVNSVQYFIHEIALNQSMWKILNVLSWSLQSWIEGVHEANINKVIVSYLLVDRLYLKPEEDLSWDGSFEKLKEYLTKFLPTIKFEISDELPKYFLYSDKKFHSDYKNAVENNDYKGIFIFLNAFEPGGGSYNSNYEFIRVISKISAAIDEQLIAVNIGNYSPLLMKLIISHMSTGKIIKTLKKYQGDSPLPLLIGLVQLINPIGNNTIQEELLSDHDFFVQAAGIVKGIFERVNTDALFSYISKCSNISMNKLWHAIYSAYLANNTKYIEDYINQIDFSHDTGEIAYDTFAHFGNESDIDVFSEKVYYKFLDYLNESDYQHHLFSFTSYHKYILRAITVLSDKSFSGYLEKLEVVSTELLRCIYSWQLETRYIFFSKWIYWILASKQIEHDFEINKDMLKHTYTLLNDSRIMNVLKTKRGDVEISFEKLIDLLDDPESVNEIVLPLINGSIIMGWTKA